MKNQQTRGRAFKKAVEDGEVQPFIDAGMTALQISKRFNVSESTVVRHCKLVHRIRKYEPVKMDELSPARKLALCGVWR